MKKKLSSFRLNDESLELLEKLSKRLGINKTAVIELIIREKARSEGIEK